ncbi:MAG: ferredoxin--NADP reductase [Pseudomonadota bacterium]
MQTTGMANRTNCSILSAKYTPQTVLSKTVWLSDKLFSLKVTRDPDFQFVPGQFARLGLSIDAEDLQTPNEWRAYSMVSHPSEDALEFFSVVVPDGKFSPKLAALTPGDTLWINKTVFGFLTLEQFASGEDLWLISTGTGLSAYISMLREASTWQRFKRIVVLHGVRHAGELAYRDELLTLQSRHGANAGTTDSARAAMVYLPVTSQEPLSLSLSPAIQPGHLSASRLTTLLACGELEARAGVTLEPDRSRVMLCGNPAMVTEMRGLLAERGFAAGRRGVAGNLAVENYW